MNDLSGAAVVEGVADSANRSSVQLVDEKTGHVLSVVWGEYGVFSRRGSARALNGAVGRGAYIARGPIGRLLPGGSAKGNCSRNDGSR